MDLMTYKRIMSQERDFYLYMGIFGFLRLKQKVGSIWTRGYSFIALGKLPKKLIYTMYILYLLYGKKG
jgi:hypothetical protein